MSLEVNELMKAFTGTSGLAYGVDTAIKALRPGAKFVLGSNNNEFVFSQWYDPNGLQAPTNQEIWDEFNFQKKLAEYYQYSYDRCNSYPDGFEQLDMLWHALNEGIDLKNSVWFNKIKEIKEKYPKPEGVPPVRDE